MVSEIEEILANAKDISKKLKIKREEALLLIIARELVDVRTHVDDVVIGVARRLIPKEVKG